MELRNIREYEEGKEKIKERTGGGGEERDE